MPSDLGLDDAVQPFNFDAEVLQLAQQVGGVGWFEWDFAHQTAKCSAGFFAIFGLPAVDGIMASATWATFVHPDDRDRIAQHLARVLDGQERPAADYRIVAADGSVRWVTYVGRLAATPAGNRLIGTVADVTERHLQEERLLSSQAELKAVLEMTPFMLTRCSRELTYRFVSREYAAMLGRTPADIAGRAIVDVIGQEGFETIRPYIDQVLAGATVTYEGVVPFLRVGPKDLSVTYTPERDVHGSVVGWVASMIDVSERRRADRTVRRLAAILEATPDFVAIATGDGRLTYMNEAGLRLFGAPPNVDITTLRMEDVSPAWVTERTASEWLPTAIAEGRVSGEGALLTHAGTEVPVSFVLLVHKNEHGEVEYLSTIARDISRTKALEQTLRLRADELAAANQAKDDFLATLSHELRTPLNVVRGRVAMLQASISPDTLARTVDVIQRNTALLQTLVDDLLDVSRLRRGQLRLECSAVQIAPVIEAAIQAVDPARAARSIRIARRVPETLPPVWADAARLQQVIWNLLANAVKFTGERGTVMVDITTEQGSLTLSVRDDGIGLAADALERVFEPFWQADPSATRQFSGLGLGLSIARSIVELHGGHIWAESDGPGRGATFSVRLPAAEAGR